MSYGHILFGGSDYTIAHGGDWLVMHQPWYDPEVVLSRKKRERRTDWCKRMRVHIRKRRGKLWSTVGSMLRRAPAYRDLFFDPWDGYTGWA